MEGTGYGVKKKISFLLGVALCTAVSLPFLYQAGGAFAAGETFEPLPAADGMSFSPYTLTFSLFPPLKSWEKTDGFGGRYHPITGALDFHYGTDLAADMDSGIYAAADGTVEISGEHKSYGNYLVIRHSDRLSTLYAHCSRLLVEAGEKVKAGEKIALVGMTGEATGPHLHFELIADGVRRPPETALMEENK